MTEKVYIPTNGRGGGPRKIHTDPDCPALQRSRSVIEKDKEIVGPHKDECKICSGDTVDRDKASYQPNGIKNKLLEMDPNEVDV